MAIFAEGEEFLDLTYAKEVLRPDGRTYYRTGDTLYLKDDSKIGIRAFTGKRWPNATLVWRLNSTESYYRQQLEAAFELWRDGSGIQFVERTNQTGYVDIIPSNVNLTAVGYYNMAVPMDLASWGSIGTLAHEIGHALGAQHEHQRSDRDTYVNVDEKNVIEDYRGNFTKISSTKNVSGYDFLSIMHYAMYVPSFSIESSRPVISPKAGYEQYNDKIGHLSYLSDQDKTDMMTYYGLG
jgi:Astacin (Peptidase family M12A)